MMVERRRQRSGSLRPEPLEERRKRLAKLLSRSNKALRDGIQLSEAITGDGAAVFRHVLDGPRRHCVEAHRLSIRERPDAGMAEDEEPGFRARAKATKLKCANRWPTSNSWHSWHPCSSCAE